MGALLLPERPTRRCVGHVERQKVEAHPGGRFLRQCVGHAEREGWGTASTQRRGRSRFALLPGTPSVPVGPIRLTRRAQTRIRPDSSPNWTRTGEGSCAEHESYTNDD
ncbi:MAG: hypothetical protein KatS3mg058_3008 [Roseiflexus sp.]|nr:MAG: hypothetical protein KatS3mg058_3008 [Roseiflexus sp.]